MPVKHVWKQRRHPTTTQRLTTTTTSPVASEQKNATPSSVLERCGSPEWTTIKQTPSNATMAKTKNKHDDVVDALASSYVMKSSTPTRTSSQRKSKATISQSMAEDANVGDEVGDENENGDGNGDGGVTGDGGVDGNGDVDNTVNSSPINTTAVTTSPTSKIQTVSNLCMYVIGAYLYNLTISDYALFLKLENDDIGNRTTCKYYYGGKFLIRVIIFVSYHIFALFSKLENDDMGTFFI